MKTDSRNQETHRSRPQAGEKRHTGVIRHEIGSPKPGLAGLQQAILNPRQAGPAAILSLQQTVGNQAVQRLITGTGLQQELGAPQPHETRYQIVLDKVGSYYQVASTTRVGNALARLAQGSQLLVKLEEIVSAGKQYTSAHAEDKIHPERQERILSLTNEATAEKRLINKIAADGSYDRPGTAGTFTWYQAVAFARSGVPPRGDLVAQVTLQDTQETSAPEKLGGGQITPVHKITYTGNYTGVFKGNETKLPEEGDAPAAHEAGISPTNAQTSMRAVAMYRLNQLLGVNVIHPQDRICHSSRHSGRGDGFRPGRGRAKNLENRGGGYNDPPAQIRFN